MKKKLQILVVEDDPAEHLRLTAALHARLPTAVTERVGSKDALLATLSAHAWDVVLSSHHVSSVPLEETLAILRGREDAPPLILVSDRLGDEAAAYYLGLGVSDFVLTNSLVRLAPAIERAVEGRAHLKARLEAEAALRQSQKMDALGRLAGGVAHDFNNLLCVIASSVDLALEAVRSGEQAEVEDLQEIKQAAARATSLTRQLLLLSRSQPTRMVALDLREVVDQATKLLRRLLPENVELGVWERRPVGTVLADAGQLEQVLVNLVVNARDALEHGGHIDVVLDEVEVTGCTTVGGDEVPPGRYASLCVRDDGCGMGPEVLSRLFEPFFTTKARGSGTGLGLATVYSLVKQAGGFIDVTSQLGLGTVFEVMLPRATEHASTAPEAPAKAAPRGSERVMVVEDEVAVRSAIQRLLVASGYQVTTAGSAEEALDVLEREDLGPELLITDLVMPGMSGVELVEDLERRGKRPPRVLFTSGHLDRAQLAPHAARASVGFLEKPFDAGSLNHVVRATLDRGTGVAVLDEHVGE